MTGSFLFSLKRACGQLLANIRAICYHAFMSKHHLTFLIFGDLFGKVGRALMQQHCARLQKKYKPDFTIANSENLTHGSGISNTTINEMMDAGIDFFTGGNHSLDNHNGQQTLAIPGIPVIRPANIAKSAPGDGYRLVQVNGHNVLIINLLGTLFMPKQYANPFTMVDTILEAFTGIELASIIVDFHAETTAEKLAMAHHLDGRASLLFGTHTHVPTADERIFDKGLGYISDIGFNGPLNSVIGLNPEMTIRNFTHTQKQKNRIVESGPGMLCALLVTIDTRTRACAKITRITEYHQLS